MSNDPTRRHFLLAVMAICLTASSAGSACASGGNSGSGSSNSGKGGGGGEGGDDDDDDDDDDYDDYGGGQYRARHEVSAGRAVPLRKLIAFLKKNYPGRVLDVDLKKFKGRLAYRVKLLENNRKVRRLWFDALTLERI
jgi:hypothetical protein